MFLAVELTTHCFFFSSFPLFFGLSSITLNIPACISKNQDYSTIVPSQWWSQQLGPCHLLLCRLLRRHTFLVCSFSLLLKDTQLRSGSCLFFQYGILLSAPVSYGMPSLSALQGNILSGFSKCSGSRLRPWYTVFSLIFNTPGRAS